jgi:hypothetical protein
MLQFYKKEIKRIVLKLCALCVFTVNCFFFFLLESGPSGLNITRKTLKNFAERITRLYEQGADSKRVGQYIRHWLKWASTFRQAIIPASRDFIRICMSIFLIRYLVFCAEPLLCA